MNTRIDDDSIEKVVELKAPIARVWRALTDHEEFSQWFRVKLDQPFEPGGISTGHSTYPGHEHRQWYATVERMDPERLFSLRWNHDDVTPSKPPAEQPTTLVEFRLEEIADGTRLTITESGFSALPETHRAEVMQRNAGGWAIQAENIAAHVEGRQ